jgi:nucleotide-binding universal stress UspA family protein
MTVAKHILLATDFSEGADQAVDTAVELVNDLGARLTVLHVHNTPPAAPEAVVPADRILTSDDLDAETQANLEQLAKRKLSALKDVQLVSREKISAASEICDYARDHDIDMIVMGTHGRTGLTRFLIGSVAEKVVRHADVPVMVVPHPKARKASK